MMIASSNNKRKQTAPRSKPAKTCDKCEFSTNEIVEFIDHMKMDHNLDEIYPCDLCVFYTESLWDYQGHMENHLEQKPAKEQNVSFSSLSNSNATMNSSASTAESTPESESIAVKEDNLAKIDSTEESHDVITESSPQRIVENASRYSERDEDSDEDEEEDIGPSDEDGENIDNELDEPKSSSSPIKMNDVSSNLLTTITNSANTNDYYDKKNKFDQKQSNKSGDCFANKMIYDPSAQGMNESASQAFNYSVLNNQDSRMNASYTDHHGIEKVKRHYNSEVDPARYRKVLEEGVTKFACSLCGNTYKWRKSLNKHWKEKHITEVPPPLDAPVTVKLRSGNTTINCIATGGQQHISQPSVNSNMLQSNKISNDNHNSKNWNQQSNKSSLEHNHKHKSSNSIKSPTNSTSQLPFSPSLLVAAAAAANAATSGSNQFPSGQLHPAYWTVFHQYLNSATSKPESNKFSINNLSISASHKNKPSDPEMANHRDTERPLDLSMKNPMSRHSSMNSVSSNQSNSSELEQNQQDDQYDNVDAHKTSKRKSRRSDFNMQQILQKNKNSRSSSRCSSTSSASMNSSLSNKHSEMVQPEIKNEHYQSYTEDESLNLTQNSSKNSQSAAAAAAAAATAYNQKLFVCSICDAKFHVVDHINEHFLKNHYNEYQRELSSKSPPRNTNVAQQNEEWNLSDPNNPLKCIKCDFVGRWPTELQKHAASHSTSRPFKCLICSLTYKWRWDLAKHFDRTHPNFRNPYKKRDRDAARSTLVGATPSSSANNNSSNMSLDQENIEDNYLEHDESRSRSRSLSSNGSDARNAQIHDYSKGIKKELTNLNQSKSKHNSNRLSNTKTNGIKQETSNLNQLPLSLNPLQGSLGNSFNSISPNQQQQAFANNPMYAYFTALQNNLFQQQTAPGLSLNNTPSSSTSSSSSNQISPFSLLQQQKNPFMSQPAFNQQDSTQNPTATILAAAMTAISQGGMEASNMSQLLPHLLQNLQNPNTNSSSASSTSSTSSNSSNQQNNKIQENFNSNLLSPSSSSSSHSYSQKKNQPPAKKQKLSEALFLKSESAEGTPSSEKEARNFLCFWCDFRGRWRSEIIQHMRCHHAREKPYRCSACMYASNWKWDVQKHTKKQHPNNQNAKIIEISDQILFPDLKDMNFFENVKPTLPSNTPESSKRIPSALNLTPPNSSSTSSASSSSSSSSINSKPFKSQNADMKSHKKVQQNSNSTRPEQKTHSSKSLCCQQCPYVACNLSDLRRHLIVHSNEQPYHCCSCDFKSKWKSDVKKHQRNFNHIGPILVGKKAMQKVIENLGLDKNSMMTLYGPNIQVIDNKQCKSNEKLIDEDNVSFRDNLTYQKNKSNKFVTKVEKLNGVNQNCMKRKQPDSDNEDYDEVHQYDDEDYEQLNEEEDLIDDEYEQVLAYNNNANYDDLEEQIDEDQEQAVIDEEVDQLNEDFQEDVNSQFTDDNNCPEEDLIDHNLNEFEEEIDC